MVIALGHFTKGLWSTREKEESNQQSDGLKLPCSVLEHLLIYSTLCLPPGGQRHFSQEISSGKEGRGSSSPAPSLPPWSLWGLSPVLLSHPVYCLPGAEVEPGFPLLLGKCSIYHRAALDPGLGCFCSFLSSHCILLTMV